MNREILLERLAAIEAHIARADHMIQKQKAIATGLERSGRDAAQARQLLVRLEEYKGSQVALRDQILSKFTR